MKKFKLFPLPVVKPSFQTWSSATPRWWDQEQCSNGTCGAVMEPLGVVPNQTKRVICKRSFKTQVEGSVNT